MDIKDIKDLIITIDNTSIDTVEIEKAGIKIMISKGSSYRDEVSKAINPPLKEKSLEYQGEISVEEEDVFVVKSPIVGVFYESPSPGEPPFVKIGDRVENGDVLCIIEAMKIMNEIECEESGEIVEILVKNEDVVQYGQDLMKIRR